MPVLPHQIPVEPDTPDQKDPIHQPPKHDHPGPDNKDDEFPEEDDDEDNGADPWWMRNASRISPRVTGRAGPGC